MDSLNQDEKHLAFDLVASWQLEQIQAAPLDPTLSTDLSDRDPNHLGWGYSSPRESFSLWGVPELRDEMVVNYHTWWAVGSSTFSGEFVIQPSLPCGGYVRQLRNVGEEGSGFAPLFKPNFFVPPSLTCDTLGAFKVTTYLNLHPVPTGFPTHTPLNTPTRHTTAGRKIVQQILKDLEHIAANEPVDYLVPYSRNLIDEPLSGIQPIYHPQNLYDTDTNEEPVKEYLVSRHGRWFRTRVLVARCRTRLAAWRRWMRQELAKSGGKQVSS